MRDRIPTVRSRELGEGIRQAIRNAGMRPAAVSRQLGWSTGRISRIIYGKRGGSAVDIASILAVCKVTGEERDRLIALSYERELPNWLQLPRQLRTLINHEKQATTVSEFELLLIPGLLQTEACSRCQCAATCLSAWYQYRRARTQRSTVGGHEKLPWGGQLGARWRS